MNELLGVVVDRLLANDFASPLMHRAFDAYSRNAIREAFLQLRQILDDNLTSYYLGERCKFCGHKFKTVEDRNNAKWVGQDLTGCVACRECFNINYPPDNFLVFSE